MSAGMSLRADAFLNAFSLEVSAKAMPALRAEAARIPRGTIISIPWLASEDDDARLAAACAVRELGFEPMPHLSARRIGSHAALERFLERAAGEAGVARCLLIAGDLATAEFAVRPAQAAPAWLAPAISGSLEHADFVSSAYLLETHSSGGVEQPPGLLIWLVVDLAFAERAARLVTTAIQPLCSDLDVIIDLAVHDVSLPLPAGLDDPQILPIFFHENQANLSTAHRPMSPEDKLLALLPGLTEEEKERRTREGMADVDAGRTIPHEELLQWIRRRSEPS